MSEARGEGRPRVAVTGASGYLGGRIADALEREGFPVERLSRSSGFSLAEPPGADALRPRRIGALIHCAHDFTPRTWPEMQRLNVEGSRRLFDAARAAGVGRIVFVSSLAAFEGCRSIYGRAKLEIERIAAETGAASVRPGTIWGERPGGIMGDLASRVESARVLPVVSHPGGLRLAHEEDVVRLTIGIATGSIRTEVTPWFAADARPWKLREIVSVLAARRKRRVAVVGLPWRLLWNAGRAAEGLGVRLAFRSDSLLSLGNPAPDEEIARLAPPPFRFRSFR